MEASSPVGVIQTIMTWGMHNRMTPPGAARSCQYCCSQSWHALLRVGAGGRDESAVGRLQQESASEPSVFIFFQVHTHLEMFFNEM